MSNAIEAERFKTLHKLYRVTAYVIKFLKILWKKSKAGLTTQDLHEAKLLWIKDNQLGLEKDKNFTNWKVQIGLFQDGDQIWRCGGRLQNARLPFSTVHPILLDGTHTLAKLIVSSAHLRVQHNGVKETLGGTWQFLDPQGKKSGEATRWQMCYLPSF